MAFWSFLQKKLKKLSLKIWIFHFFVVPLHRNSKKLHKKASLAQLVRASDC